ncbi:MAG TPA: hypothetical protein VFW13_11920 [Phenylobacterium sp.]|nr:hypothetical protein [Phenylobacterium sp.]
MRGLRAAVLLGFLAYANAAWGTDVNAPLDTRPTLQTEMHRGYLAASGCAITLEALQYAICISHVSDAEEAKISNANPFNLGLFLAAWRVLDQQVRSFASLPDNRFARAAVPESQEQAASEFVVLRGLQKRLGLSDLQVRAASGAQNDALAERWNFWLAQPSSR